MGAFLKSKIMDNIHKYFYLILYTAYIRQAGDAARNAVDDASKAEVALSSGKCAIPADQLKVGKTFVQFMEENGSLRTLIEEGKGDLQGERDMPQGDHKKRAKYRFASKTLMRLLPKELLSQVEGLIEKKTITLDLYDILGQCTWGQK